MPHPLDGAHIRAERADLHIGEAQQLIREFAVASEHYVVADTDPQTGNLRINLTQVADLPRVLPAVVSDAVHNLRSALDYLIYELAAHDSGSEKDGTQFPIEDVDVDPGNPNRGFSYRKTNYLKWIKPVHYSLIEACQPYKGAKWAEALRDISNPDKHRKFSVIGAENGVYQLIQTNSRRYDRDGATFENIPALSGEHFYLDAYGAVAITLPKRGETPLLPLLRDIETNVFRQITLFKAEF